MSDVFAMLLAAWHAVAGEMKLGDWIELVLAGSTIALAFATFRLARYTRRTAEDTSKALVAFREQAAASKQQAEIAMRTLEQQRDQTARQMRVHMTWVGSAGGEDDPKVDEDPRSWGSADATKPLAMAIEARVRNVSPVTAYLDRVEHGPRVGTVIIQDPYVPSGQRG